MYAIEGENKAPEEPVEPTVGVLDYKGHNFVALHFRTPTTCDSCNKPLWHMLHPPTALECKRKEDNVYNVIMPCDKDQLYNDFMFIVDIREYAGMISKNRTDAC